MNRRTPTLASVMTGAVEAAMAEMHTCMPGRVESYDDDTQSCSVQPLIKRAYFDETGARKTELLPIIHHVPVMFQGAGGRRIKFPVRRGNIVLILICEASLDKWLQQGGTVDPLDDRRFDLSDAVAIPGLLDRGHATDNTPIIEFTSDGEIHVGGSSALVTRTEFMAHVHGTSGAGGPSTTPSVSITGTSILKGA